MVKSAFSRCSVISSCSIVAADLETELLSQFYKRVKQGLKEKNQCRKIKT